jgi:hypothetical protein
MVVRCRTVLFYVLCSIVGSNPVLSCPRLFSQKKCPTPDKKFAKKMPHTIQKVRKKIAPHEIFFAKKLSTGQ